MTILYFQFDQLKFHWKANKSSVLSSVYGEESFFVEKVEDEPFWEEHDNEKVCWNYQKHLDHYAWTDDDHILRRN